jgi:4-amino-4-deoxy-L-arabinose transferase-like glycosyltransferase
VVAVLIGPGPRSRAPSVRVQPAKRWVTFPYARCVDWVKRRLPDSAVGRLRLVVIFAAAVATMLKLQIAARTFGTNDVGIWGVFAEGVRDFGPVGIYGHHFEVSLYNHGPLAGWLLLAINWLLDHDVTSFPFLIRLPACLADFVTALLVFELVRLVRSLREAAVAALLVSWSPVLFVVSGFHGNTDPVFVMFALLSVYLLVVRGWALAAGAAFGIAVSIKLVPVVLAPLLVVVLVRLGWRRVGAFVGGGAIVFLLLWLPVVVTRWQAFRAQVLEYRGSTFQRWGLPQFLSWADLQGVAASLAGPGRFGILLVSGLTAAAVVWRRPDAVVPAVGLSFVLFLVLSPAFGMQYLAWALAAAYLIDTRAATGYNLAASAFVLVVYSDWSGAPPWRWYQAWGGPFSPRELALMVVTWVLLTAVGVVGLRHLRGGIAGSASAAGSRRRWAFTSANGGYDPRT